jgi:hypothetical protein
LTLLKSSSALLLKVDFIFFQKRVDVTVRKNSGELYFLYQKSFGKKEKFRINSNLIYGRFNSNGINDTPQQFFRITSIGMNVNYDLVKCKSVSLLITSGGFLNYSRGLFGTSGENEIRNSSYFSQLYFGGTAGIGIRINSTKSRFAYEIKPLNVQIGNNGFELGYIMFGMDIKIKK